jgi:uncharacterized Zn-binding protein involved in type VI secretion
VEKGWVMPGAVREGDAHAGHASGTPNPFHRTTYVSGQSTVYVNGKKVIRKGDSTSCGDPAVGSSNNVYANGKLIHRLGDSTGGHGSWGGNSAAQASGNVIINAAASTSQPNSPEVTQTPVSYRHYVVVNYSGDIKGAISFNFSGNTDNLTSSPGRYKFNTTSAEGTILFTHSGTGANGFSSITINSPDPGGASFDGYNFTNLTTVNGGTSTFNIVAQDSPDSGGGTPPVDTGPGSSLTISGVVGTTNYNGTWNWNNNCQTVTEYSAGTITNRQGYQKTAGLFFAKNENNLWYLHYYSNQITSTGPTDAGNPTQAIGLFHAGFVLQQSNITFNPPT